MLGISFGEISIIMVVALVVIGPEKLPEVVHTVGKLVGRLRHFSEQVRSEIEEEFKVSELKKSFEEIAKNSELESLKKELTSISRDTEHTLKNAGSEFQSVLKKARSEVESVTTMVEEQLTETSLQSNISIEAEKFDDELLENFDDYYSIIDEARSDGMIMKAPPRHYNAAIDHAFYHPPVDRWHSVCLERQLELNLEKESLAYQTYRMIKAQEQRVLLSEIDLEVFYTRRIEEINQS